MKFFYAVTWLTGQQGKKERLEIFMSKRDRDEYVKQYPTHVRNIEVISDADQTLKRYQLNLELEIAVLIKDPHTGKFQETS